VNSGRPAHPGLNLQASRDNIFAGRRTPEYGSAGPFDLNPEKNAITFSSNEALSNTGIEIKEY